VCIHLLENKDLLKTLPKRVQGDLSFMTSDVALYRHKAVCVLARRMAKEMHAAIVARQKQVRENGKTVSKYSYK